MGNLVSIIFIDIIGPADDLVIPLVLGAAFLVSMPTVVIRFGAVRAFGAFRARVGIIRVGIARTGIIGDTVVIAVAAIATLLALFMLYGFALLVAVGINWSGIFGDRTDAADALVPLLGDMTNNG